MPLLLMLETATSVCSVSVAKGNTLLKAKEASGKNAHSELLSVLIDEVLHETGLLYSQIDAIGVSSGPGSYTGLRIGVSTAKGLCYALDKPLISVGTLQSMALGMMFQKPEFKGLLCPMIDARRMEVYSAIFDTDVQMIKPVSADIIEEGIYASFLEKHPVLFFGDGASKTISFFEKEAHAVFDFDFVPSSAFLLPEVLRKFQLQEFEDIAYFEPFYLKDFIAGKPKVKGLY